MLTPFIIPETPTQASVDEDGDPEARALSYGVSSTNIVYGLPEYVMGYSWVEFADISSANREEKYNMLRAYRSRYFDDMMRAFRNRPYSRRHEVPPSLITYDLCCQYFKNLHALNVSEHTYVYLILIPTFTHTYGCSDSASDDEMPPLEPISRSEPSTPVAETNASAVPTSDKATDTPAVPTADTQGLASAWEGPSDRSGDGEGVERAWASPNPSKYALILSLCELVLTTE
jgi:hypothetical protein